MLQSNIIQFTAEEADLATRVGILINDFSSYYKHSKKGTICTPDQILNNDIQAAASEFAVCLYMQEEWIPGINTKKSIADVLKHFEVRRPMRPNGDLVIRPNDPPNRFYILVSGKLPTMTIVGGAFGHRVKKATDRYPLTQRNGKAPAQFVPQADLLLPKHFAKILADCNKIWK
jgi:hypothetical protein